MYCCTVWHYCSAIFVLKTLFFKYLYCKNSKINLLFTFKIIIGEIQQMRKIVTKPSSLFMWRDFYTTRKAIENVYIHLPFCQKKCHFCAFPIHAIGINQNEETNRLKQQYLFYLQKEIKTSLPVLKMKDQLTSLYLGGGTPSLFNQQQLQRIVSLFPLGNTEVTLQLNPSELYKLKSFQKMNFNRFSLGIQTFNNQLLNKMNRFCQLDKQKLLENILSSRPTNLSLDFILDFCAERKDFQEMLSFIEKVQPEHITLYMLEVNQGSFLQKNLDQFKWLPGENQVVDKYIEASERLKSVGYHHYEISNFSKGKQFYSKHNKCYWAGNRQFLAFGMGATSLTQGLRVTRPTNLKKYFIYVDQINSSEAISSIDLKLDISNENILQKQIQSLFMSGLRCIHGVKWQTLKEICPQNYNDIKMQILSILEEVDNERKHLINWNQIGEKIVLTSPKGYLLADQITFRIVTNLNL